MLGIRGAPGLAFGFWGSWMTIFMSWFMVVSMVIPSSGSNQDTPEVLPSAMEMDIAPGLVLGSGLVWMVPENSRRAQLRFPMHLPPLESKTEFNHLAPKVAP